jgi:hypothetical protein
MTSTTDFLPDVCPRARPVRLTTPGRRESPAPGVNPTPWCSFNSLRITGAQRDNRVYCSMCWGKRPERGSLDYREALRPRRGLICFFARQSQKCRIALLLLQKRDRAGAYQRLDSTAVIDADHVAHFEPGL